MGNISSKLVIKYATFFDESRQIHESYRNNSDWARIKVHHFSSGWQNLSRNPNFEITNEFINFADKYVTKIYDNYEDDTGPFYKINGFVNPHISSQFQEVLLISIFLNKNAE